MISNLVQFMLGLLLKSGLFNCLSFLFHCLYLIGLSCILSVSDWLSCILSVSDWLSCLLSVSDWSSCLFSVLHCRFLIGRVV